MRIHELAKELGVQSKDLLGALEEMGYAGRTASSSVPEETVARLRASGGKAIPGSKPKQVQVEQLPAKRPPRKAPVKEETVAAPAAPEGDGQVAVAEDAVPAEPEGAPAPEAVPAPPGLPTLKVSRGATPQDIAAKISSTPAEVVKTLIGMGQMVTATHSLPDDVIELLGEELGYQVEIVGLEEEEE